MIAEWWTWIAKGIIGVDCTNFFGQKLVQWLLQLLVRNHIQHHLEAFSVVQILSYFYKAGYLEVISQALSLECKVRFSLQLRLFWGWPLHPLHLCATVVRGWLGRRNVPTPAIQRDVMDVIVWSILIGPLVSPLCDGKTFGVSLFNSEHDDNCCHL